MANTGAFPFYPMAQGIGKFSFMTFHLESAICLAILTLADW